MNTTPCRIFAFGVLISGLFGFGGFGLGGCASSQPAQGPAATQSPAAAADTVTPLAADVIYRPPPWEKTYREGKRIIRREAKALPDSPNKWVIEEYQSVDDKLRGGLVRQTFLERGPDGSVFLNELNLTLENKVLTFDPALVLMPGTLTFEKPCVSEGDVVMREGTSADSPKTRGHATQTTRLVKQKNGASVVTSDLVAKFDYTTIDRSVEMQVVPGRGIVKEIQDRTVKFGLLNLSRTTSTAVLIEQPAQP